MINTGAINLTNPTVYSSLYTYYVGGIAGYMYASDVQELTNLGAINISHQYYYVRYVGGVLGYFASFGDSSLYKDWVNNANISISNGASGYGDTYYIGGLVLGYVTDSNVNAISRVYSNMYSKGIISGSSSTNLYHTGGLFGYIAGNTNGSSYMATYQYMYSDTDISKNYNTSTNYYPSGISSYVYYANMNNVIAMTKFIGTYNTYTFSDMHNVGWEERF